MFSKWLPLAEVDDDRDQGKLCSGTLIGLKV